MQELVPIERIGEPESSPATATNLVKPWQFNSAGLTMEEQFEPAFWRMPDVV